MKRKLDSGVLTISLGDQVNVTYPRDRLDTTLGIESEFFRELIANLAEGETEIELLEENPISAVTFLSETIRSHPNISKFCRSWNREWAILSAKWLCPSYVEMYATLAKDHTLRCRILH